MWRVLIVEDDARMRDFFASSVRACPQLVLAGEASTVTGACDWLDGSQEAIDVLLIDLGLPDGSGLQVIKHASRLHPACESLVISMFGDESNVVKSIEAGALGYIHKDAAPQDIAASILEMKSGASPISPMIARRVIAKFLTINGAPTTSMPSVSQPISVPPILSVREREVLALIARGFSYGEIAKFHNVTVHTVQTHIKNLYRKLAVHSRGEAVYEAMQLGLLSPGP